MKEGELADLILIDGDPISDIDPLAGPAANFDMIMEDGVIEKGTPALGRR